MIGNYNIISKKDNINSRCNSTENCIGAFKMMMLTQLLFILFFGFINVSAQTGHWEKLNPPNNPGFRDSHGMAPIGHKKVLLFAGYNGYELNDTWIFDLEKNDWQKVNCKNPPPIREGLGMCQISESQVLIFGGAGNSPLPTYNDLWLFDLDSMDWKELNPKGWQDKYFPLPTYRMGMAKHSENSIVIYGGVINDTSNIMHFYSDDTWIYYLDSNRWEWRNIGWPSARSDHMMTNIDSNLVFMVGGDNGAFLDNWIFDSTNYYWFKINDLISNITNEYLSTSAITSIEKGIAVLFGGLAAYGGTGDTWYDSTWVFDYNGRTWTKLDIHPHPSDRLRGRMARIDRNKALLFGGASQTNRKPEDTWLFVLDSLPSTANDEQSDTENEIESISVLDDEITIKYHLSSPGNAVIKIFDIKGDEIFNQKRENTCVGENLAIIPFENEAAGVYVAVILLKNHTINEKFIFFR